MAAQAAVLVIGTIILIRGIIVAVVPVEVASVVMWTRIAVQYLVAMVAMVAMGIAVVVALAVLVAVA